MPVTITNPRNAVDRSSPREYTRQRAEQRAENLERLRIRECVGVYNGWIGIDWDEFVKSHTKQHNLDYMNLLNGIELRDITEEDIIITPWDTPEIIRQRGKEGLIRWQAHPDREEIKEKFKKNLTKERERMRVSS